MAKLEEYRYVCGFDENAEIVFKYRVDHLPMEIRPVNNFQGDSLLLLLGSVKEKSLICLDKQLNITLNSQALELNIDKHDFQFLPNGNILILHTEIELDDFSDQDKESKTNLQHYILSEVNIKTWEIVKKWNSKNYFTPTEAAPHVNLNVPTIDYCHINAFQYLEDGSVLISSRNMDEITKINWSNGEIIWRMGGRCNEFRFINDPIGFCAQHQARLYNNELVLFDNGAYHEIKRSSVLIYDIDQSEKNLKLTHRFYGDNLNFSERRGGVTKLDSGNYFVCWGANKHYQFSELDKAGKTITKGYHKSPINYRMNKGAWKPELLKMAQNENGFEVVNISKHKLSIENIWIDNNKIELNKLNLIPEETYILPKIFSRNNKLKIAYKETENSLFYVVQHFI